MIKHLTRYKIIMAIIASIVFVVIMLSVNSFMFGLYHIAPPEWLATNYNTIVLAFTNVLSLLIGAYTEQKRQKNDDQ